MAKRGLDWKFQEGQDFRIYNVRLRSHIRGKGWLDVLESKGQYTGMAYKGDHVPTIVKQEDQEDLSLKQDSKTKRPTDVQAEYNSISGKIFDTIIKTLCHASLVKIMNETITEGDGTSIYRALVGIYTSTTYVAIMGLYGKMAKSRQTGSLNEYTY